MAKQMCTRCLETVKAEKVTKGSFVIEVLLWLCFLFPGVIYSVWRLTTRYWACPSCGSPELVPSESRRAKQLRGELETEGRSVGKGPVDARG